MILGYIYINIIIYNICANIEAGSCMKVILPVVFIAMVVDGPCHLRIYFLKMAILNSYMLNYQRLCAFLLHISKRRR